MAKKNKFARKYRSLTDLGNIFNLSAIAVGKIFSEIGLRNDDGSPSDFSFEKGLVVSTPLKNGTPHFRWHFHKCRETMIKNGIKLDSSFKIRKTLKSMLSIYRSEAMEMGGGIEYKFAIHEFFELIKELPVKTDIGTIQQLIDELKTNKKTKGYFLEVVCVSCAESHAPTTEQVNILFDMDSYSVLDSLSKNNKVDEFTRQKAKQKAERIKNRKEPI